VADLVADFETPFGLELLAKVHWVIRNDPVETTQDIVARSLQQSQEAVLSASDRAGRGCARQEGLD
jgi:hypothetical protein